MGDIAQRGNRLTKKHISKDKIEVNKIIDKDLINRGVVNQTNNEIIDDVWTT